MEKKDSTKGLLGKFRKIVANHFCGPLKDKQKEKCADFYEKWAENEETKFEKTEN